MQNLLEETLTSSMATINGKNGTTSNQEWVFLVRVVQLLQQEGILGTPRDSPVVRFLHPAKLQEKLAPDLCERPADDVQLLAACRAVLRRSVRTGHPHFHNQLFGGVDPYGLAGAWISEALNTSQYTFEVGPAFTLIEHAVIQHVLKMIGFNAGDGIFAPGGSVSNMYAMVLARYRTVPDVKRRGMFGLPPLVAFMSEDGHYSTLKGAHWLGIGTDNVVRVRTDASGRMLADELEKAVRRVATEGRRPFIVVATAGTTVLGAFDPLGAVADVCERHRLWMHVDACWGGSLMLSKKYSYLLNGLDRADSVAWNPHKMLGAPLQCSLFLIKEKGLLHCCNSAAATYLFQQDKFYDVSYDTGDKSVQCGRKVDAFKLWLLWRARGDSGLRRLVDNAMDCSRYFRDLISDRSGFRLVTSDVQCSNVCFWYIPQSLRGQEETTEWWDKVHMVTPKIKESLTMAGTLMIGYQPLVHKGLKNFFRLITTCHPPPTLEDMDFVVQQIEQHAANL